MTPKQAYQAGADYIVMGREIINSNTRVKTVNSILEDLCQ